MADFDNTTDTGNPAEEPPIVQIKEVKYSLPEILEELKIERRLSYFSREILDQVEITRIFAQARIARARNRANRQ